MLKSYLESCLCLVSFSEAFYVCALVSLPLFLSLSFFFVCLCLVNDSENYLCAVGSYECFMFGCCSVWVQRK